MAKFIIAVQISLTAANIQNSPPIVQRSQKRADRHSRFLAHSSKKLTIILKENSTGGGYHFQLSCRCYTIRFMINKISVNIVRENKILSTILALELAAVICLTIALLIIHRPETPADGGHVGTVATESRSCSPSEYRTFDERVFYYPDLGEVGESILSTFSDSLTTNYPDPDIKVLITNTPTGPDDEITIRGYQVVDGIILEDTFFAISIKGSEYLSEFPLLINPGQIKPDGLIEESEAKNIAYSAIETETKRDNMKIEGTCSYELYFTNSNNGVISRPPSGYYYEFTFYLDKKRSFPRGHVFMDGKTGEVLDLFIDSGIRT